MTGPDGGHGRPERGLQNERTELAWQRSALSVMVVALLLIRAPGGTSRGGVIVAYAALLTVPVLVWVTSRRYAARHDRILATGVAGADRRVVAATSITVALGLAALSAILLG